MIDCLIIDDELSIAKTVCEYFNLFNVSCDYADDYESGLKAVTEKKPSLILLDINLGPKSDNSRSGFELCKKLREISDIPIIFLSVRDTDDDILAALGVGGDDYVTKPFSMAVLLAKVKAVLKRSGGTEQLKQNILNFGSIGIERENGRVYRGDTPVKLKPMELKLLLYLIDNKGRRVTKDELLEKVWGGTFVGEGTLSVHIRHLREKLEDDPKNPDYIKTMWGSGYMFELPCEVTK